MATERTFSIIKPDATERNLTGKIIAKLEDAGFVAVTKRFEGRKPLTEAAMTAKGRKAFVAYLDAMQGLVAGGSGVG